MTRKKFASLLAILVLVASDAIAMPEASDSRQQEAISRAKNSHTELATLSRVNTCMQRAIDTLTQGCESGTLSEEGRAHLALELANCHLQRSHKTTVQCTANTQGVKDFGACTAQLSGDAWNTYTAFYTHTDNLCYYYESIRQEERREQLLQRLQASGEAVSRRVEESAIMAQEVLKVQSDVVKQVQENVLATRAARVEVEATHAHLRDLNTNLASNVASLGAAIEQSERRVQGAFSQIYDSVERVLQAQEWLFAHLYTYACFASYAACCLALLFATSIAQLASARVPTLLSLWGAYTLELIIASLRLLQNSLAKQDALLIVRYATAILIVYLLINSLMHFKDAVAETLQCVEAMREEVKSVLSPTLQRNRVRNALLSILKEAQRMRRQKRLGFEEEDDDEYLIKKLK